MEGKWPKFWKQRQEEVAANDEQVVVLLQTLEQLEVEAEAPADEAEERLYVSEG
jgi:hypothetical protein